jgi:hypothetical protein
MRYKFEKIELEKIASQSHSMGHLLSLVGVIPAGGNYATMKRRLKMWDINTSHWEQDIKKRQGWLKGKTHNWAPKTPLSEILVENSTWGGTSHKLKLRLIKEGILQRKCYDCELTEWKNQPIPIELEHINGNRFDCRIENLTILCPNCHALTKTYRGKNKGTY